jgi:uncharacterized protein (TIGR02145 family)
MKRLRTVLTMLLLGSCLMAQIPDKFSYQAVIRNSEGDLLRNGDVGIRIQILKDSGSGSSVYAETHSVSTNENGLITLEIGGGTAVTGSFSDIDWSSGTYFLKTEIDPTAGVNYSITGVAPLLSVPYALYASVSANGFSGDYGDLKDLPVNLDEDETDDVTIHGDQAIAGIKTFTDTLDAGHNPIIHVKSPVDPLDAANKAYVDQLAARVETLEEAMGLSGTFTDTRDGNTYKWVKICDQIWMAENLRWENENSVYPNNDASTKEEYGILYEIGGFIGVTGICPSGWHIPLDNEWKELELCIGMDPLSVDSLGWRGTCEAEELKMSGSTGFNAIFPGEALKSFANQPDYLYRNFGITATFWCSDEINDPNHYYLGYTTRMISINTSKIYRYPASDSPTQFSVRCLKD